MRMTRSEMKQAYPNTWLGLSDVAWKNNDGVTLESAEVAFTDLSSAELLAKQISSNGQIIAWFTNDHMLQLGMVEVM